MRRTAALLGIVLLVLFGGYLLIRGGGDGNDGSDSREQVNLRLLWVPQAQFAGYVVAKEKGFYEDANLEVNIRAAGPDLYPNVTVASGTDDIGIAISNQVITARSNNVPLVTIAQIFQDSANRYVLKKRNRIDSLQQLRGQEVGLWMGGDEAEFTAMLRSAGMTLQDVEVIPQDFSVAPFLADRYELSMVTVYNELNQIADEYPIDSLQILSPRDYNAALVSDAIITREQYLEANYDTVVRFLHASLRGWAYALEHPEETIDILMDYNPELNREDQKQQLRDVLDLVASGQAGSKGIGYVNPADYETAVRILERSGQIEGSVEADSSYDTRAWEEVDDNIKEFDSRTRTN